ncbi:MAG TPA: hypothetical protein VI757_13850 [Bacteroidia bacterium]|nr:hypothetical protein [Bacteroidia bacterium]
MNVNSVKLELAKRLLNTNDKNIINYLKAIFDTQDDNWWAELPDEIKMSVEKGLRQSERGETVSHAEARKKYRKWLRK